MASLLGKLTHFPGFQRRTGFREINLLRSAPAIGRVTNVRSLFFLLFGVEILVVFLLFMNGGQDISKGVRAVVPILPQGTTTTTDAEILQRRIDLYTKRLTERTDLRKIIDGKQVDWPTLLKFLFSSVPEDVRITSIRLSTTAPRTLEVLGQSNETAQLLVYREVLQGSKEIATVRIKATIRRGEGAVEFTYDLEVAK